jgi:hypothetical protein
LHNLNTRANISFTLAIHTKRRREATTNLNETKLEAVVVAALVTVKGDTRWTNAIIKAEEILTSGNPYIHFTGDSLLMLSDSGEIYEANGVCQCKAFAQGQACKHRAAYKLVVRYNEAVH